METTKYTAHWKGSVYEWCLNYHFPQDTTHRNHGLGLASATTPDVDPSFL